MTTPFTIIKPITVSDSNFTSSSLSEADYAAWSSATTYALADRVIITTGQHKVYESLAASNINFAPATNPLKWVEISATNRWKVFDSSGGSKSSGTSPVSWAVATGRVDSVAVLEIEAANSVTVLCNSVSEGTVYNQTFVLTDSTIVGNWFEYFFSAIRKQTEVVATNMPLYQDMTITVTVTGAGTVKAGNVIFGNRSELGATQYGARAGIIDYSKKEVDAYGRATLVKRTFSKRMDVTMLVENAIVDSVQYLLSDLRATPVLWVAAKDQYELLTVYGFYRDFSVDVAYTNNSICTLQVEGLT